MSKKLKSLINIAMIISILLNVKSILFPIKSMGLSIFVATILGRSQFYYFLITIFFIIPMLFFERDKKRETLIALWFITIIILILKIILEFIRFVSNF